VSPSGSPPPRQPHPEAALEKVLDLALDMGAVYADARFQDRRLTLAELTLRRTGGRAAPAGSTGPAACAGTDEMSRHIQRGLGVRVIGPKGGEGFAATSDLTRAGLGRVVSQAVAGALSEEVRRPASRTGGGFAPRRRRSTSFALSPPRPSPTRGCLG